MIIENFQIEHILDKFFVRRKMTDLRRLLCLEGYFGSQLTLYQIGNVIPRCLR